MTPARRKEIVEGIEVIVILGIVLAGAAVSLILIYQAAEMLRP